MKLSAAILLAVVLLLAGGCAETGESGQAVPPGDANAGDANAPARVISSTLIAAWSDFLADAVIAHKKTTGQFPPHARDPNFPAELAVRLQARHEWVFLVPPRKEQQFAQGRFDDADVAVTLDERIADIRRREIRMPWLAEAIIRLRRRDELQGASLVLARRVLDAQLMDVISFIQQRRRSRPPSDSDETH
jgi:hypothetical protein